MAEDMERLDGTLRTRELLLALHVVVGVRKEKGGLAVLSRAHRRVTQGLVYFQTLQYLQQNAKERAELAASAAGSSTGGFSAPPTASKISMQELEELRKQLGSVATGSTLQQVLRPAVRRPHTPRLREQVRRRDVCVLEKYVNVEGLRLTPDGDLAV